MGEFAGPRSRDVRRALSAAAQPQSTTMMIKKTILPAGSARLRHRGGGQRGRHPMGPLSDREADRPAVAAARRQAVRQPLPELPLGVVHALQIRLRDIGLTNEEIKKYLMFTTEKVGDTMQVRSTRSRPRSGSAGRAARLDAGRPVARRHRQGSGSDYLYTYPAQLLRDPESATGWNNRAFPTSGCPTCCGSCRASARRSSSSRRTRTIRPSRSTRSPATSSSRRGR